METVVQNARDHFQRHKLKRASGFGARSRALSELGRILGLEQAPLRIECYDVSNLGPTDKVGSMVVFEDGLPKRSDYRRFEIKGVPGQDDFASMEEMRRPGRALGGEGGVHERDVPRDARGAPRRLRDRGALGAPGALRRDRRDRQREGARGVQARHDPDPVRGGEPPGARYRRHRGQGHGSDPR